MTNESFVSQSNMPTSPLSSLQTDTALLDIPSYRERVIACWLGKAVGGTLGMPFEGVDGPLNLSFYEPVPTEMLPNDDLDLQVVWACVLDAMAEPKVDRHVLAKAWQQHVEFPWDEYGVGLRNLANGLHPPLTGSHDNWFTNGMGAPIRSEVWACLAPGNPALAAAYAYEDGCFDHSGDGIYGEMFFAALQSMAFVESDTDILLDNALETLPADSSIRAAIQDTRRWWLQSRDWKAVRDLILRDYGHENFTDVTMNVAFTILGWIASEGDFSEAICIAVNCGKDTDCTGATVGALMGIIDPDCIAEKWLSPIGRDLVLSPGIVGLVAPKTLDEFTDMVLSLRDRIGGAWPDAETIEQSTAHLKTTGEIAFSSTLPTNGNEIQNFRPVVFAGTYATWPIAEFEDEFLIVRYRFAIPETRDGMIMLNTPTQCRVWFDNQLLFERDGGRMAPSFHRIPSRQSGDVTLTAGEHEIVAAIRRPASGEVAQWVVGVGDPVTKQWLPEPLLRA